MKKFRLRLYLLIIVQCFGLHSYAAVNVESLRREIKPDTVSSIGGIDAQLSRGNTDFTLYSGNLRFDYLSGGYHAFMISQLTHGDRKGERFAHSGFTHLRGVADLNKRFFAETFLQIEFNEFTKLKYRRLFGGGLRMLALKLGDDLSIYVGVGLMREVETYDELEEKNADVVRSTNYVSLKCKASDKVDLLFITYYQVRTDQASDYRVMSDFVLGIKLSDALRFSLKLQHKHDSMPPDGVEKRDLSLLNGISFYF